MVFRRARESFAKNDEGGEGNSQENIKVKNPFQQSCVDRSLGVLVELRDVPADSNASDLCEAWILTHSSSKKCDFEHVKKLAPLTWARMDELVTAVVRTLGKRGFFGGK